MTVPVVPAPAPAAMADGRPYQLTAVVLDRGAVLIGGASGTGKSMLALALIDRGATFLGDDSLLLEAREGCLFARPHPRTAGLIEVRNLGLVAQKPCARAPVSLAITLTAQAPRFIERAQTAHFEGMAIPHLDIWPADPLTVALKVEIACRRYGLSRGEC